MVFSTQLCPFIAKHQDACYIATSILDFFALCCHLCRATGCWTLCKMATGSQFEEIPYLILRCWRFALIHRPSMIFHLVGSMIGKTGNSIMRCWPNSLDGSLVFVYFLEEIPYYWGAAGILCMAPLPPTQPSKNVPRIQFTDCLELTLLAAGCQTFREKTKNKLTSCFVGRPGLFIFSFTTLNE